jgi:pimeloyl-ACP methyl ester carboxylesterase/acyl-coenzyme A thioesterase PaaI-like protein
MTEYITLSDSQNRAYRHIPVDDTLHSQVRIVFLHEGLGSINQWRDFPELLCKKNGIGGFMYDRLGFGNSDTPVQNRLPDFLDREGVDELHEMVQTLLPDTFLILYGHSEGGSIALNYAIQHPEKVVSVITEAAHIYAEESTISGVFAVKELYIHGLREKLAKYHNSKTEALFDTWWNMWQNETFHQWSIIPQLYKIGCPVLSMHGNQDPYGTKNQAEIIYKSVTGKSEFFISETGKHHLHKEDCEEVLEKCTSFLTEINVQNQIVYRKLEYMYHHAPVNRLFKPRLSVKNGESIIYSPVLSNYFHAGASLHGAVYFKMLDDAAFFACQSLETTSFMLTGEFTTRFLKPVKDGTLKATGIFEASQGKKFNASAILENNGEIVARGSGTFIKTGITIEDLYRNSVTSNLTCDEC